MLTYATLHIEAISFAVILFVAVITYLVVKFKNIGFIYSTLIYVLGYFVLFNILSCSIVEYITYFVLPSLVLSLLTISIFEKKEKSKDSPFKVEFLDEFKKKFYWENINTGVAISGASGAGKTASVIYSLLKHYAKYSFAGIIYDYKSYELTEVAYPLFKKQGIKINIFAPADVNRSIRINPIAPERMNKESTINSIVSTFVMNLAQTDPSTEAGKFFQEGCESLIAGVIWRLKKEYPEKCNLPFLTAFLLAVDNHHERIETPEGITLTEPFKKLVDWICKDPRAELAASVFLTGLSNPKQTGSLYSTLAAALRKIASPEIFYLLGADEVPLDLNADNNRSVISIVNDPSDTEEAITPVLATVVDACLTQMSKRGRKPSFVLLDEAPTIKIMNLSKRIATLRSFGFSFVYCLQDMIQAVAQWDGKKYIPKSILANLSNIAIGKVNEGDTADYYEKFFEIIEQEQVSISKGKSDIFSSPDKGGTRVTTSKKERRKVRGYEFFKLKQGEFFLLSGGEDKKVRFYYEEPETELPLPMREVTPTELEKNYLQILENAKKFLNK